jgi:hypothetical protein
MHALRLVTAGDPQPDEVFGYGRRDADGILGPITSLFAIWTTETNRKFDELRVALTGRFEAIERRMGALEDSVAAHHKAAHDDRVASDARIKPIRTLAQRLAANWKSLGLVALVATDVLSRIFGVTG